MLGDACPRQEMIDEFSGTQKEEGGGSPRGEVLLRQVLG